MGIVFIVFLTPILMIALIVWYKIRKNRMQNETMLKLAEKGIVPTADAMQAIGTGRADAAIGDGRRRRPRWPSRRARIRKAAAWSDLRKGVLMCAVGFAITFYSMLDDAPQTGSGWCCCSSGSATACSGTSRTARRAPPSRALPARAPAPGPGDTQN